MTNPQEIYDLLLDYGNNTTSIQEVIIGLTWTICHGKEIGLCMSPALPTRTLSWPGTLVNRSVADIAPWLQSWDSYQATIGMAAINAVINSQSNLQEMSQPIISSGSANLAVFEHFLPKLRGKRVSIIGRYPGLDRYENEMEINVIELKPGPGDFPAPASEYLLPKSDWVFLTGTSIPNKTFPRLVELSRNAKLVLMGPTVPWLAELAEFGIDYLAGVTVVDPQALRQTVAEGGGVRIFETGVQYRLYDFS
ncbi:DUF364 domain-containing protein [Cyanobacterium sp. uoEpiScrs1]|uniref:DUF364 domain-containing protein n=1 Tax=Cyanobacterium sp. uoEpiScrs1 TaxID=2976343 RepID=UPI00226A412B|nr:DUF364 domain-containing protein [Cyanobacterium sp. uoEpiScrs1]